MTGLRGPGTLLAAVVLVLAGCASRPPVLPERLPQGTEPVELVDTVFFPQTQYHCGPAALATVLQSSGVAVVPDDLVDQVYVPARQGSLQVELLAATRRAGRIPYVFGPGLTGLHAELEAGRPVLVLQNLGLGVLPVWHYAVVVGLDPAGDRVILRSGTEQRRVEQARAFLRSWRLGDHWAMVALRPGELPAEAERGRYLASVAQAERFLGPDGRRAAYRAALARWPDDVTARFGFAYAMHAAREWHAAEDAYRALIADHPQHAAAYNNLAEVLKARGCLAQSRRAADRALAIAGSDAPSLVDAIKATRDAIPAGADASDCNRELDAVSR